MLRENEEIMYKSNRDQISVFDDATNFIGAKLSPTNRWVRMSEMIPWDLIDEKYEATFKTLNVGQPALSARMAIGTLIIREKQRISDEETLEQILDSPYLQWFIGLTEFTDKAPFDRSSITYFRKRVTPEILAEVNDYITGRKKIKRDDDDDESNGEKFIEQKAEVGEAEECENKGTLIVDASCVPADIKYPTDVNLLNESREKLEKMILNLHRQIGTGRKAPKVYKKAAKKAYLRFAKNRKPKKSEIRKAIKKQLGYVRRNLKVVDALIAEGGNLTKTQERELSTITTVYTQQEQMYREKTHTVENRIVSLHQNWVRPIVRGKTNAFVEFGAKVTISLVDGYSFVEKIGWEAYNEGSELISIIENYKTKTGVYPERVLADKIFRTRTNLQYCKEHGIKLNGPKLGRPPADKNEYRAQCQLEREESKERNAIEGKFGEGKRRYYLEQTKTRLKETTETQIHLTFLVMNLSKKLRISLRLILKAIENSIFEMFYKRKSLMTTAFA